MSITNSYFYIGDYLPMVTNEEFPDRFNRLCADAKLPKTQNALGKKLGVSGTFVNMVRNQGKLPSMETAIRWAHLLNCTVDYLLTGRDSESGLSPRAIEIAKIYDSATENDKALIWRNVELIHMEIIKDKEAEAQENEQETIQ